MSTRSAMVRVLTDLFAVRPHHTQEEIRHYEEIMQRMVPDAEPRVLLEAATRLAPHPHAPLSVLQAMIERDSDCASVILARSPVLTEEILKGAAQFGSGDLAAAVARRSPLDEALVEVLATRQEAEVWQSLSQNDSAVLDDGALQELARRGRDDPAMANALCGRTNDPAILLPLFLYASAHQRAAILLEAERDEIIAGARHRSDRQDPKVCDALEKAALAHDEQEFRVLLAAALRCDVALARKLRSDATGEPLAAALAALGMSNDAIMRVFLMGDPAIAHSCDKIETLHRLVGQMSFGAALRITRAMLGGPLMQPSPARAHRPVMDQTASPTASRPTARPVAANPEASRKLPLFLFRKRLR